MDETTTAPPPLTAHLTSGPTAASGPTTSGPTSAVPHINHEEVHLSRDHVPWKPEVWTAIDRAVAHEVHRTRKSTKFLPQLKVGHHVTNVEQDVVLQNLLPNAGPFLPPALAAPAANPIILNVYEGANLAVIELKMQWALSNAQVRKENELHSARPEHHEVHGALEAHSAHPGHQAHPGHHEHHPSSTAIMLVRRTANTLSLAVDALVWLGSNAFPGAGGVGGIPLFSSQTVSYNGIPADTGLTCLGGGPNAPLNYLIVNPVNAGAVAGTLAQYSTNTVSMISKAVTDLAANGYGGPYVAVLPPYFFADSFFPLPNTLQRPADLIIPLLDAGYYDSAVMPGFPNPVIPNPGGNPLNLPGALDADTRGVGFVLSIGGNVVEFVNGLDPVAAFSQIDGNGNYIFQLKTRVAVKKSDSRGIEVLIFK